LLLRIASSWIYNTCTVYIYLSRIAGNEFLTKASFKLEASIAEDAKVCCVIVIAAIYYVRILVADTVAEIKSHVALSTTL
jgi:hypothetical protein